MGDDLDVLGEGVVAAGVIGVVMGIDEGEDLSAGGFGLAAELVPVGSVLGIDEEASTCRRRAWSFHRSRTRP